MEYKIDYLTLTIKPDKTEFDVYKMENFIFEFLGLEKYKMSMQRITTIKYYDYMYRYNDINIKVPYAFNADLEGFCIEFSGQGLAWFKQYKEKYNEDFDYKEFLTAFFSFADLGYTCRCTRIDMAFDDIDYTERDTYKLDLKRIEKALLNGEFVSLFSVKPRKKEDLSVECGIDEQLSRATSKGKTLYLGNRKSSVFCRFYDKLAEQISKGADVDSAIKHWSRLEFEFKDKRAMSVCDSIIVLDASELSKYLARVVNRYVCFKVVRGVARSHLYRQPQKRWWTNFIGTIEKARLVNNYEKRNRYIQAKQWFKNSIAPTLFQLFCCESIDSLLYDIMQAGFERCTAKHEEIQQDFINMTTYEQPKGYEIHKLTTNNFDELVTAFERIKEINKYKQLRIKGKKVFETEREFVENNIMPNKKIYGKKITEYQSAQFDYRAWETSQCADYPF